MAIFKKVDCAHCGNKTNPLTRTKLVDGDYLCFDCIRRIPPYILNSFSSHYDIDDYRSLKDYIDFSNSQLRPVFCETHSYYTIHIDERNKIFYLGDYIREDTVFFLFQNVSVFDLIFQPENIKEGLLGDKVIGNILLQIWVRFPYFYREEKIASRVKAKAKTNFLGTKISYEDPAEMCDFKQRFKLAWAESLEEAEVDEDSSAGDQTTDSALSQAMALFMLDSLDGVSQESLRTHRNRLVKAFHPDKGDDSDTKYMQKINAAYEILKKHITEA